MTIDTPPWLRDAKEHYGVQIADMGEDGELVALGHIPDRLMLAAANRHARLVWGETHRQLYADATWTPTVVRTWAVTEPCRPDHCEYDCGDPHIRWGDNTPGAYPITIHSGR